MSLRADRKAFRTPDARNRPLAVFPCARRTEPEALIQYFDRLMKAGAGGAILNGSDVPGGVPDEACLQALTKRARKRSANLGLKVRLPDEYTDSTAEPSGDAPYPAGQLVFEPINASNEELVLTPSEDDLIYMTTHPTGGQLIHGRYLPVVFTVRTADFPGHAFFRACTSSSATHANPLSAAVTRERIRALQSTALYRVRRHVGSTLRVVLLDDAGIQAVPPCVPWDPELASLFLQTRGYGLVPKLAELVFDCPGCETTRFDFWTLVGEMFREGFAHPLQTWSAEQRTLWTMTAGDPCTPSEQLVRTGPLIPLAALEDVPAARITANADNDNKDRESVAMIEAATVKAVVSVADQLERDGAAVDVRIPHGVRNPVSALKSAWNRATALGARNVSFDVEGPEQMHLRNPIPLAAPGPAEPYWPYLEKFFTACGRLSRLFNQSHRRCRVLLLDCSASLQSTYAHNMPSHDMMDRQIPTYRHIENHFLGIVTALLQAQIDFDLGNETVIARHGVIGAKSIGVGAQEYEFAIVPPSVNMLRSTLEMLQDFATGGGNVVFVGTIPHLVDGRPSKDVFKFTEQYGERITDGVDMFRYARVIDWLVQHDAATLTVTESDEGQRRNIRAQRRWWDDQEVLHLANVGALPVTVQGRCRLRVDGHLEEWVAETGGMHYVCACNPDEAVELQVDLPPHTGRTFVAAPGEGKPTALPEIADPIRRIQPDWSGHPLSPNLAVVDLCRLFEHGVWQSLVDARDTAERLFREATGDGVHVTTRWPFRIDGEVPAGSRCEIVLPVTTEMELKVNNEPATLDGLDRFLAPNLHCVPVEHLHMGENIIEIAATYREPWEFGPLWIRGMFRVVQDDGMIPALRLGTAKVAPGAWSDFGLPYYAGNVVYETSCRMETEPGQRIVVDLSGLQGFAEVRLNDEVVDHVLWEPYLCDLTGLWASGEINTIEIRVANSLHNLHTATAWPRNDRPEPMTWGFTKPPEIVVYSTKTRAAVRKVSA